MTSDKKPVAVIIISGILGYGLIIAGVASLIGLTWHIWELYQHPELSIRFAETLKNLPGQESVPFSLLKLGGWQIMLLLLLIVGKVSVWLIESGKRILD
jgi:hypothetical protein